MSQQPLTDETNHPTTCDVLCSLNDMALENAKSCLLNSPYPELWKITCEFYEGVLTLNGVVGSYFLKQMAHAAVAGLSGVDEVANRVDVEYPLIKSNDWGN
jgi:osmotically-inducible protein OsmY